MSTGGIGAANERRTWRDGREGETRHRTLWTERGKGRAPLSISFSRRSVPSPFRIIRVNSPIFDMDNGWECAYIGAE
jgi:hypothetical protein